MLTSTKSFQDQACLEAQLLNFSSCSCSRTYFKAFCSLFLCQDQSLTWEISCRHSATMHKWEAVESPRQSCLPQKAAFLPHGTQWNLPMIMIKIMAHITPRIIIICKREKESENKSKRSEMLLSIEQERKFLNKPINFQ